MLGLRFNQAAYTVTENVDSGVVTINLELVSMVPDHGEPNRGRHLGDIGGHEWSRR